MVEPYTIPVGTVLYTGGFTSVSTDPTRYRFFTKNKDLAAQFAKTAVSEGKTRSPVVSAFKVVKPIQIHLQKVPSSVYYFDTPAEYASEEAQALCRDGFHGYASADPKYGIEDIGLCGVSGLLEKLTSAGTRRRKRKTRRRKPSLPSGGCA